MSIYATNYIVDDAGNTKLVKHLNKIRIDRSTLRRRVGGWNKSGQGTISDRVSHLGKKTRKMIQRLEIAVAVTNNEEYAGVPTNRSTGGKYGSKTKIIKMI